MTAIVDLPILVFVLSFVVLWLFAQIGVFFRTRLRPLAEDERQDFGVVLTATMTLLGLLIGFSFSMAISRYDQRKNYEAEEANAIGTEYVRAELLPVADATKVRGLLKKYLDQRVLFYETWDSRELVAAGRAGPFRFKDNPRAEVAAGRGGAIVAVSQREV